MSRHLLLLQHCLSTAPVLSLPDFAKVFCIETDTCHTGVGVVLLQEGHPLAFISKPLGPKTQGLSAYEKEYLAILVAVEQWRSYLLHGDFIIYIDQKSLIHLNEQRLNTPWQQKVFTKLLGLQYKIIYKQGTDNRVVDALSRKAHDTNSCCALSVAMPQWCQSLMDGYLQDEETKVLLTKLAVDNSAVPNFPSGMAFCDSKGVCGLAIMFLYNRLFFLPCITRLLEAILEFRLHTNVLNTCLPGLGLRRVSSSLCRFVLCVFKPNRTDLLIQGFSNLCQYLQELGRPLALTLWKGYPSLAV